MVSHVSGRTGPVRRLSLQTLRKQFSRASPLNSGSVLRTVSRALGNISKTGSELRALLGSAPGLGLQPDPVLSVIHLHDRNSLFVLYRFGGLLFCVVPRSRRDTVLFGVRRGDRLRCSHPPNPCCLSFVHAFDFALCARSPWLKTISPR